MKKYRVSITCADLLLLLLLFLYALDFFDLSGMLLTLAFVFLFAFFGKAVKLDKMALLLVLFSASYTLSVFFYEGLALDGVIKYALAPWGSYVLGLNILRLKKGASSIQISKLLLAGFFMHGALNLLASMTKFGVNFSSPYRQAYDFWQDRVISVTTASLYYSPLVFFAIGVLLGKNRKRRKVWSAAVIAIAATATLLYQNRTLAAAAAIVSVMGVALVLFDPQASKRAKARLLLGTGAVLGILLLLWIADAAGIRSFIQGTSFYARLTGASGEGQDRTRIWSSFLFGDAWKYPFGGNRATLYRNKRYVHNTWLDIFRRGGIIPFFAFTIFTLSAGKTTILYMRQGAGRSGDGRAAALAMAGMFLMFFVEPVMEANPYIFYLPLMMVGLMNGALHMDRGKVQ